MGTIVTNVRGIESVVDALQAGVWTLDRDGVTTYANQRMHEMLAAEPASLVGRPLLDFVDSVDHDKVVQGLRRRAEGRSDSYDARLRRADGTVLHVRIQASPVVEQGSFIGSVAAVTDVSDLATTTASISEALDHAEQSVNGATRLLSWVSHELRTPLNTISGFTQLLDHTLTDPTQRTIVNHIQSATTHVAGVVRDLLDFVRADAGSLPTEQHELSLAEMVAEATTLVDSLARESGISIVSTVGDFRLVGDHRRVVQILVNLLSNAIKYGGSNRTVTVHAASSDGLVRCSVSDQGPGVAVADRQRVFRPFERLANNGATGAGLGLTIAESLARTMGGTLELASEPDQGATFTLALPSATQQASPSTAPVGDTGARVDGGSANGTILYVEDEPLNAALVENVVALLPGRTLQVAATVADGIAALDAAPPALAILDLNLPDGTGFDVLRHIRVDLGLHDLPVFILSADATQESARRATELGANRYITKPFDLRQFLDLLDMATRV